MDIQRETDIEQLRRVAVALQTQVEQLLRLVASQAKELGALKGNESELQQKLALVEELTRKSRDVAAQIEKLSTEKDPPQKKPRDRSGPTEQPSLPVHLQIPRNTWLSNRWV